MSGEAIKKYLLGALEKVKEMLMWIVDKFMGLINKIGGWLGFGGGDETQAPPPVINGSGGGGNTTNNATYNVNQNITTDNGKAVADSFNTAIRSVNQQKAQR